MGGVYGKYAPPTQIPEQPTSQWCNGVREKTDMSAYSFEVPTFFFFCQGIVGQRGEKGEEGAKGEEVQHTKQSTEILHYS